MRILASVLLIGAVVYASGSAPAAGDTQQAAATPTYTKDVAPILFQELHYLPPSRRGRANDVAVLR